MDHQLKALQEQAQAWLDACPDPRPRPDHLKYDVFISYRSLDRNWATALRDSLIAKGYEVFLDQYELTAGNALRTEILTALNVSASGVLIWSSKTGDSEWVKREYQYMNGMRQDPGRKPPFHLVTASLDGARLPDDIKDDLYVDFRDYPDGPRGGEFAKLTFATHGTPMDDQAIRLAADADQAVRDELQRFSGWRGANLSQNYLDRCDDLIPAWLTTPQIPTAAAEDLLALGNTEGALRVLKLATECFPRSLRIQQLTALTNRRSGAEAMASGDLERAERETNTSLEIASGLLTLDPNHPETLGILASAHTQMWEINGSKPSLRKAAALYRQAFSRSPRDYYTGINAAAKSAMLGELNVAEELAREVAAIVEEADPITDYWGAATIAEASLIQGDVEAAADAYRSVLDLHAEDKGSISSTLAQVLRLIGPLKLSMAKKRKLLAPFVDVLDVEDSSEWLKE